MRCFQQLPKQRFEHAHAVVLKIFRQMGVIAGDEGDGFALGEPDASQTQNRWVDHVDQVWLEGIDGFGDRRPRQGQLQLWVERQGHGGNAHHLGSHVVAGCAFRTKHHHLISGIDQMLHRFGEPGDDAVDFGEESFGKEGDFQGFVPIRRRCQWLGLGFWSRPMCRGCDSGRSDPHSEWRFPPPPSRGRHPRWWV